MNAAKRTSSLPFSLRQLTLIFLFLLISYVERPFAQDREVVDRILKNADDSYVVTLHVTREGTRTFSDIHIPSGRANDTSINWRHGPTSVSTRLVTLDADPGFGDTGIMVGLGEWQGQIASYIDRVHNQKFYEAVADEMNDVIQNAKAYADDAELVLRVLEGIEFYAYIEERDWEHDPGKPDSGLPTAYFEGATSRSVSTSPDDPPKVDTDDMDVWSSAGSTAESTETARRLGEKLEVVVWRYTPEEMQRVGELLSQVDEIREKLTLDLSEVDLDPQEQQMHEYTPIHLHTTFRDALITGLLEVVRLTWWLGPNEAPASMWAGSPDELDPTYYMYGEGRQPEGIYIVDRSSTPYLHKDAELRLPPLPTDTLMVLNFPQLGFVPNNHPGKSSAEYGEWQGQYDHSFTDEQRRYVVSDPARQRHRFLDRESVVHSKSLVHAAVQGERFEGRLTIQENHSDEYFSGGGETRFNQEERQTHQINWSVTHNGEIWKPSPVALTPRLVTLKDGNFVPFEGELAFGDAFAVEGRLENPAARLVYTLEMQRGGQEPFDVLLYPTDDDPRLVRSKLHYLMWDMTEPQPGEAAESGANGDNG